MERVRTIVALIGLGCLAFATATSLEIGEKYLFLQNADEHLTLMELTWPRNPRNVEIEACEMSSDPELVREALTGIDNPRIMKLSYTEIENLREDCQEISRRRRKRGASADLPRYTQESRLRRHTPVSRVKNTIYSTARNDADGWHAIWPGTQWCGDGDEAANYDDLGMLEEEDKCCRAHDLCKDIMPAGTSKFNLTNDSSFTKLSCGCDEAFYDCLMNVDSFNGNTIGNIYFNILDRECYYPDYPLTDKCKDYYTFLHIKCKEYQRDTNAPKVYQWKENKFYWKLPGDEVSPVMMLAEWLAKKYAEDRIDMKTF